MDQMQIDYEADKADRAEARERECEELLIALRDGSWVRMGYPETTSQTAVHHMVDAVLALDYLAKYNAETTYEGGGEYTTRNDRRAYECVDVRDSLLDDLLAHGVVVNI